MRLYARYLEPEALRTSLRSGQLAPSRHFTAHFPAAGYVSSLARTEKMGELDEEAALALVDAAIQLGAPGGDLELSDDEELGPRFLSVAGAALDDVALASQLLKGGLLGRVGHGRFGFGSLPLKVIQRQVSTASLQRARERVDVGWDSDLVNLLESAALIAERQPEHHLLLLGPLPILGAYGSAAASATGGAAVVSSPVVPSPVGFSGGAPSGGEGAPAPPSEPPLEIERLLVEALGLGAHDVFLQAGRAPSFHGPRGSSSRGAPVSLAALKKAAARLGTSVDEEAVEVTAQPVELVGRVRVSASKAGLALRILGKSAFLAPGLGTLQGLRRGLVVIGGPPGSGRSTSFSALLHEAFDAGAVIASLEEPVSFPRCDFQWNAAPQRFEPFLRAVRTSVASVVGFDLIDDARSVELGLQVAGEGRLGVCTMLGLSVGALVDRLVALDGAAHRRRLAEHLAAIACLTPGGAAQVLRPSEALRRFLATEAGPVPAALLEVEGP